MTFAGHDPNPVNTIEKGPMPPEMCRVAAMATRAILSGLLVELRRTHGEEAVQRVHIAATDHLGKAVKAFRAGAISTRDREAAERITPDASAFIEAAFQAAYAAK